MPLLNASLAETVITTVFQKVNSLIRPVNYRPTIITYTVTVMPKSFRNALTARDERLSDEQLIVCRREKMTITVISSTSNLRDGKRPDGEVSLRGMASQSKAGPRLSRSSEPRDVPRVRPHRASKIPVVRGQSCRETAALSAA
jgi:hypothetical protein